MGPNIMLTLINILQDNLLYLTFETWVGWEGQNVAMYNLWALTFVCLFLKLNLKSIVCFLLSLLADVQALAGLQGIFLSVSVEWWALKSDVLALLPLCIPVQSVWQGCTFLEVLWDTLSREQLLWPHWCTLTTRPLRPEVQLYFPEEMMFWVSSTRFFTRAGRK